MKGTTPKRKEKPAPLTRDQAARRIWIEIQVRLIQISVTSKDANTRRVAKATAKMLRDKSRQGAAATKEGGQ